jgi:hypothetical protein
MDILLETYNLPRLNHEEKENLHGSIIYLSIYHLSIYLSVEIESVIKNKFPRKNPRPDVFTGEF